MVTRKAIYKWKLSWILLLNILHSNVEAECQHEGKTYANGERLKTPPGGECKVCYCRGGEVQCAEVSCYIRTDCEGKTVLGQCCPKYDHCPPKEPLLGLRPSVVTAVSESGTKEVLDLWPMVSAQQNSSEESSTEFETPPEANGIESATVKMTKATQVDFTDGSVKQLEQPRITIHEIIPEIKEIPMTAPSSQDRPRHTSEAKQEDANDIAVTDPEPDSSEISEVFQQPPPVLRIGDKLLFLKRGELVPEKDASTPTSVITIIGAEGLQRGFEDSAEMHEGPVRGYDEHGLFNNSNDLEPKTSESTHILSLVKKKSATTTERSVEDGSTAEEATDNTTEPPKILILQVENGDEAPNRSEPISENATRNNYDIPLEENPAYPAIPDAFSPENVEHYQLPDPDTENARRTLENERNEKNATISHNTTLELEKIESVSEKSSLKVDDITTMESDPSTTEETTTTTANALTEIIETTAGASSETDQSAESLEETTEDSGENTTPKNDHASIISDENASVEPSGMGNLESVDMLREALPTSFVQIDDVEIVQNSTEEEEKNIPAVRDVEMINVDNLTHVDFDVKSDKTILPAKNLDKRESSLQEEADEVFRELEAELSADSTERTQTLEEEKEESDKIFQELLEETSTPRTLRKGDKKAETLQRVTDTIAGLTLREKKNSYDTNILGLISNFFGPSSRLEGKK